MTNAEVDYIDADTGKHICTEPFHDPAMRRCCSCGTPMMSLGCGRPTIPINQIPVGGLCPTCKRYQ